MLGNVGVSFPVYVGDGSDKADTDPAEGMREVFGAGRRVGPDQNTSVSATALVRVFNPTMWRFEARVRTERWNRNSRSIEEAWEWAVRRQALLEEMHGRGVVDLDARVARLIVVHNPWAAVKLDLEILGGPHDTQWTVIDETDGTYGVACHGRLAWEVPGVVDARDETE